MQYTDYTSGAAIEYEPIQPAMPMEMYPAPVAAERVYERGSIAEAINAMFREADERAAMGVYDIGPMEHEREARLSTPEAFRTLLETVQSKLKESDAIEHLKTAAKNGDEITTHDVEAAFRAYERALRDAFQKLRGELSPEQIHQLKYAATSELDWTLRDMITKHVVASSDSDVELRYDPTEFFLIANPKARKIQYMDSHEVLNVLRHSMSRANKEQLGRDLAVVRQYEDLPAVHDVMSDDEFSSFESSIN